MIKGILIDIDNTLYDYNHTHTIAMDSVYNKYLQDFSDLESFKKAFIAARSIVHSQLINTASSHNRLLYFQKTLELLNIKNTLFAKTLYDTYWNTFLDNINLFEGVEEFFIENSDKKICLVTDLTAYIQYRKIEKMGISQYVDFIVTSEEVGVEKPNSKMFETALQKMQMQSDEVCMIGDSYEKDIVGAKNLNIKAYWLTDKFSNDENIFIFNTFKGLRID